MITREAVATYAPSRDLSLRTPPNWTAVIFFATLAALHLSIAIPAFAHGRWEGYLSLILGCLFILVSLVMWLVRYEVALIAQAKCIRLRSGFGLLQFQRFIPFADVHAVRLTLSERVEDARIEILCDNEDIECPPTTIPRQEALFLAMLMDVQLIKISDDACAEPDVLEPAESDRLI